jgi:hypothetical protein
MNSFEQNKMMVFKREHPKYHIHYYYMEVQADIESITSQKNKRSLNT